MKPTNQMILLPSLRDNETLAEAVKRYEDEKVKRDPLLVNQGKMEGGIR